MRCYLQWPLWQGKDSSLAALKEVVRKTIANAEKMVDSATVSVTYQQAGNVSMRGC
jgi:hypothetical protein